MSDQYSAEHWKLSPGNHGEVKIYDAVGRVVGFVYDAYEKEMLELLYLYKDRIEGRV